MHHHAYIVCLCVCVCEREREREIKAASQVVLVVKNMPASAGDASDAGSIPGLGRSPGVGSGSPFQYSCLGNNMNRGA